VLINFDSSSLGDTIAWIPYCLEFQKKHNCHVIVCTFKNFLFEESYPELEFVQPGTAIGDIHGMYRLGWFYNTDKEPTLPNTIPLQQSASNILGLEYKEITARISFIEKERPLKNKYIVICTNSTCHMKFWTIAGWTKVAEYLNNKGFKVVNVSKERNPIVGVYQIEDVDIESTMNWIYHSEFMIGLSSGLSWLGNALNKYVFRIGSFISDDHEFTINAEQISNRNCCNSCWHTDRLDAGNWFHCPRLENTERAFECATSITPEMVISKIKRLL